MSETNNDAGLNEILVVDDIEANRSLLQETLEPKGYEVLLASNGESALEIARSVIPAALLLDVNMPGMNGFETCKALKQCAATRHIPVIFITANDGTEDIVAGFEAGGVDYVTKPFKAQEVLTRLATHLQISRLNRALVEKNNEKNEFMGIVAHDLRNPLGAIKGFAELIVEDPQMPRAELEDFGRRIADAAARMVEMVQKLLDTNRIERGEMKLNLTPTDLVALVSSVVETHRSRATAKQQLLQLKNEAPPANVLVDPSVMVQVLENLVSNAVKYSPTGKTIFVRLKQEAGAIRVEVQDEGPGLTAEDQKKLFGKFARLSAKPTGGENATGLGLSIVKKMVEAMNGKVWCESEPGKGATFIVELPFAH
jgi:signal transduction histidine kinase